MDKETLAQKQAELSKALSKAYLTHQITELESQVRQLPISQDVSQSHGIKQAASGERNNKGTAAQVAGRIDDDDDEDLHGMEMRQAEANGEDVGSDRELDADDKDDHEDWRVAVVDVSSLMWAPKAVRSLVTRGFEVVIPADGIRTLDLLKKGNSPSAIAARSAARYIEHASRQYKLLSADPSITVQLGTNYKRGSGLRIQRDDEFRKADELSSLPLMPGEEGPPKWVKSVLGCAAFFAGINKAEIDLSFRRNDMDPQPVLYVANPPLAIELAQATNGIGPETKEMREHAESHGNYLERGEGVVVLQEAERFELGLEVLRDEDDEAFELRRHGGRGRGRGGHRGGVAGSGGDRARSKAARARKEEEKQPEVKILLRRQPQPEVAAAQDDQSAGSQIASDVPEGSPLSALSPLPDTHAPPPSGLVLPVNGKHNLHPSTKVSATMKHETNESATSSAEISPPRVLGKPLPPSAHERKSPASKFVPLTRETHPVRRQAGSSDSGDSRASRKGRGRGGARGGRGGRGAGNGGGSGRKKASGKERDAEFKNGNFTLLQRPTPIVSAQPSPVPPPSAPTPSAAPATTANAGKGSRQVPAPNASPAPKTILQRPPQDKAAVPPSQPSPAVSVPHGASGPTHGRPPPFGPESRGRGRGGRRGGIRPPPPPPQGRGGHHHHHHHHHHPPPPPPPPPPHHHHHHPRPPSRPLNSAAEAFEFDDAMLRPGFGSSGIGHSPRGHHFGPPPHRGHFHGVPFGFERGPGHSPHFGRPPPADWKPAPERPPVVVLQRPK